MGKIANRNLCFQNHFLRTSMRKNSPIVIPMLNNKEKTRNPQPVSFPSTFPADKHQIKNKPHNWAGKEQTERQIAHHNLGNTGRGRRGVRAANMTRVSIIWRSAV